MILRLDNGRDRLIISNRLPVLRKSVRGIRLPSEHNTTWSDIDKGEAEEPKYMEILSEADKREARELRAEAIDADRFELYSVNPVQSYAPEEFIKADPDFWAPKAAAKPAMEGKKGKK